MSDPGTSMYLHDDNWWLVASVMRDATEVARLTGEPERALALACIGAAIVHELEQKQKLSKFDPPRRRLFGKVWR